MESFNVVLALSGNFVHAKNISLHSSADALN